MGINIGDAFKKAGLPDPMKDHKFRRQLIQALLSIEEQASIEGTTSTDGISDEAKNIAAQMGFEQEESNIENFSEEALKKARRILENSKSPSAINHAANFLIEAWEKGYGKN